MVDFGTATTFDSISAKGEYLEGVIAPGLGILGRSAFLRRAARLSRVDVKKPAKVVGTNTVAAHPEWPLLRLHRPGGWHPGTHAQRDRKPWTAGARRSLPTGGLARLVVDDSRFIQTIDDMLTLDGLRLIYERNRVVKSKHSHSEAPGKHA